MAQHYGCFVIPARVARPKDKPKVEVGVQVVERRILAGVRNRTFFSLAELNRVFAELLEKLNNAPFAKLEGMRKSLFDQIDRPALTLLPSQRYEFDRFKKATVSIDYHIEIFGHYYSVPYQLLKEKVDVRVSKSVVEVIHRGTRITSHALEAGALSYKSVRLILKNNLEDLPREKQVSLPIIRHDNIRGADYYN